MIIILLFFKIDKSKAKLIQPNLATYNIVCYAKGANNELYYLAKNRILSYKVRFAHYLAETKFS